jgi:hypothetical protein
VRERERERERRKREKEDKVEASALKEASRLGKAICCEKLGRV